MKHFNYRDVTISGAEIDIELNNGAYRGTIDNLSNDKYHSLLSYKSSSDLKYLYDNSPYHYLENIVKAESKKEPTQDMILGSLFHSMLLTPDETKDEFFILPKVDLRTKAGKVFYEDAIIKANGKTIVSEEMFNRSSGMVKSACENKEARLRLSGAKSEVSYFWKCPFTGLNFRSKVDACTADYLIEVKSSRSAKPSTFERHAVNMNYDLSAAHYAEGIRVVGGRPGMDVYFIVVENFSPYATQVYRAGEYFMDLGHQKWLDSVTKMDAGVNQNSWPAYDGGLEEVLVLNPPRWAGKALVEDTDGNFL